MTPRHRSTSCQPLLDLSAGTVPKKYQMLVKEREIGGTMQKERERKRRRKGLVDKCLFVLCVILILGHKGGGIKIEEME
jgi:hypothetical protein